MIDNIKINAEKIIFLSLDIERDAAAIASWTKDTEFSKRFFDAPARRYTVDEITLKLHEELSRADVESKNVYFAAHNKATSDLICLLRFGWFSTTNQSACLFMEFCQEQDLEEFGEDILATALKYAFVEMNLYRIWVQVSGSDEQQILLYERAGFLREVQRREAFYQDGRYIDMLSYGLLKPDWVNVVEEKCK